jgi:phage shock protein C
MERQGLYRSRKDRVFGGVAGGIAHSLNADPAIVRLIFALLVIVAGGGLLLYLILWIAIPEEPFEFYQESTAAGGANPINETAAPNSPNPQPYYPARHNNSALIVGLILIAIGALFLIDRFIPNIHLHFHDFWPLIVVFAGIALIASSFTGKKHNP